MSNTGAAILIIGSAFLMEHYGYNFWLLLVAIIGVLILGYPTGADETKELQRAQVEYYRTKTRLLEKELYKFKGDEKGQYNDDDIGIDN